MTVRMLLVDDHEIVRRGIRELLESESDLQVVAEAGCVLDATNEALGEFEVAVLDVRLPDGSGIEICRWMQEHRPTVRCLFLTSFSDDEAYLAAIMAGASGFVLKEIRAAQLIEAVRTVAAGGSLLDRDKVVEVRARMRDRAREAERLERLSPQERKILELLAEGMTNRQISETLFLAEKTVKNYVSNLLAKLGFARRTEAAVFALRLSDPAAE
jgi:DNA-binding NarL/FixJ family response regulator